MKTFENSDAHVWIPDGVSLEAGLNRCTHLGIAAHQDDLEFMAYHGILAGHLAADKWFGGVICTNGAGSSRTGVYADFSDEQMRDIRRVEQDSAAIIGRYGATPNMKLLRHSVLN